jgi:hypothetical protein
VLVRLSNLVPDADAALALNQKFAAAMLAAVAPKNRAALIGSARARQFNV